MGRTGTYITIDYLLQFVRDHDLGQPVDIFAWVVQMRKNRVSMVQVDVSFLFYDKHVKKKNKIEKHKIKNNCSLIFIEMSVNFLCGNLFFQQIEVITVSIDNFSVN